MKQNLPHIYNSCWLNSLFILLSHTDAESKDIKMKKMLNYVKNNAEQPISTNEILQTMHDFYVEYNILPHCQNSRQMLKKFYNLFNFDDSQFEIGDDYENSILDKKIAILDYEQLKSLIDYNHETILKTKDTTNKIISILDKHSDEHSDKHSDDPISEPTNQFRFSHLNLICYNDKTYIPFIFSLCLCQHYITLVYTNRGIIIYDDLRKPYLINDDRQINSLLNGLSNIEFIGYIKKNN